jgi:hypothetical protein
MTYELKPLARQKVLYDNDNATNPLTYQLVMDGSKVVPASAVITIYRRGSSTALVTDGEMSVVGSLMTYSVDTTTEATWPIETGYRADVAVTVGSGESAQVYPRHLVFDVVRFVLDLAIGIDQLVDIDDRVAGMTHSGQDDMPGLIVAARSDLQMRIESKVLSENKMIENVILDPSHLSVAACYLILSQLWFNQDDEKKADHYLKRYESSMTAILSTLRYDAGQDGDEDANIGGVDQVRLVT